jgi:hypothetical protein
LNKICFGNFRKIIDDFYELVVNNVQNLENILFVVYDQAQNDHQFSLYYALLLKQLYTALTIGKLNRESETLMHDLKHTHAYCFALVVGECNHQLESRYQNENVDRMSRRDIGLITFIGELYKVDFIGESFIKRCIEIFLKFSTPSLEPSQDDIELVCILLKTVKGRIHQFELDYLQILEKLEYLLLTAATK